MAIRVVRLGAKRAQGEGLRIGTVRRPPRGVPKSEFSKQDWYDVWLPELAPSVQTMKLGQRAESDAQWAAFARRYKAEMAAGPASRAMDLLAALSHQVDFSVGCYCEQQEHCHRTVLKELLRAKGARLAPSP